MLSRGAFSGCKARSNNSSARKDGTVLSSWPIVGSDRFRKFGRRRVLNLLGCIDFVVVLSSFSKPSTFAAHFEHIVPCCVFFLLQARVEHNVKHERVKF